MHRTGVRSPNAIIARCLPLTSTWFCQARFPKNWLAASPPLAPCSLRPALTRSSLLPQFDVKGPPRLTRATWKPPPLSGLPRLLQSTLLWAHRAARQRVRH
jgi:hypothetical protein